MDFVCLSIDVCVVFDVDMVEEVMLFVVEDV